MKRDGAKCSQVGTEQREQICCCFGDSGSGGEGEGEGESEGVEVMRVWVVYGSAW